MTTFSVSIAKGRGSMSHNNREFITENVDKDRVKDNIVYKQESLTEAYEKCFGQAIQNYNSKQKRADRRIDGVQGYMNKLKASKNGEKLFYENVVQIGNKFNSHVSTKNGKVCKSILDEYMKSFEKRNPNLYVFNAVLHLDEQTPHLHIDYIPLAKGYQKGLEVRNSLDRAFKQQGVDGDGKYFNRTIKWQRREKDFIGTLMKERGMERAEDTNLNQKHLTVAQYKAAVTDVQNEVKQMPDQIESTPTLLNKEKVTVNKKDLEQLERKAKLSLVHEKLVKELANKVEYKIRTADQDIAHTKKATDFIFRQTELEHIKVTDLRRKYEKLYKEQQGLRDKYDDLTLLNTAQEAEISDLKEEIHSLKVENTSLKADISVLKQNVEQKIQEATKPLLERIKSLTELKNSLEDRLDGMCQSLTNVVKAFNMLKYDKNGAYQVSLTKSQSRLFDGIENYVKKWLKIENKHDMVSDLEKHIGISKGINTELEKLERTRRNGFER